MKQRGDGAPRWEMHVVNEDAARRVMPVEVRPGEPFADAALRSRAYEDELRHAAMVTESLRAGRDFRTEFRCRMADGSVRWFAEDVHVAPVARGRWRAVGVVLDITERKELEQRIVQTRERLRDVVTSSPADGMIAVASVPFLRGCAGVRECGSMGVWECGSAGVRECGSAGATSRAVNRPPVP